MSASIDSRINSSSLPAIEPERRATQALKWDVISSTIEARIFQQAFPRKPDQRQRPWQTLFNLGEESAYIVGDNMRLLGGRVNAHSS